MAIYVCENPPAPGKYGILQVYKDRGRTIARIYNPLSGERVNTAPEFANTRKHAAWLAIASPLASAAHRTLPAGRQRAHYQQLAGKTIQWLKEGKSPAEVQLLLLEAVEDIRKELKQQRLQVLWKQRKSVSRSTFSMSAFAVLKATGKVAGTIKENHAWQYGFGVKPPSAAHAFLLVYPPDVGTYVTAHPPEVTTSRPSHFPNMGASPHVQVVFTQH